MIDSVYIYIHIESRSYRVCGTSISISDSYTDPSIEVPLIFLQTLCSLYPESCERLVKRTGQCETIEYMNTIVKRIVPPAVDLEPRRGAPLTEPMKQTRLRFVRTPILKEETITEYLSLYDLDALIVDKKFKNFVCKWLRWHW